MHQRQILRPNMAGYWNKRLAGKLPLAPRELVTRELVTKEDYLGANQVFADFANVPMVKQVDLLPIGQIEGLASGLARDYAIWAKHAAESGFTVRITDYSRVSCELTRELFRGVRRVMVNEADIMEVYRHLLSSSQTVAAYASQLVQNLEKDDAHELLFALGAFLRKGYRRVFLLHAFEEDNPPTVEWRGMILPRKWSNTTPYSEDQILAPVEKGLGGKVEMVELGRHGYFEGYHNYRLVRIKAI